MVNLGGQVYCKICIGATLLAFTALASLTPEKSIILKEYFIKAQAWSDDQHAVVLDTSSVDLFNKHQITWFDLMEFNPLIHISISKGYISKFNQSALLSKHIHDSIKINTCQRPSAANLETFPSTLEASEQIAALLNPPQPTSITADTALVTDLFSLSKLLNKGFDDETEVKEVLTQGEEIVTELLHNKKPFSEFRLKSQPTKNPGETESSFKKRLKDFNDQTVIAILWYFQALAGKRYVLNPETWKLERAWVERGTFQFHDGLPGDDTRRIYQYLESLQGGYWRKSSHYNDEAINPKDFLGHAKARGYDFSGTTKIQPPGGLNTKTILFGELEDGKTFLKLETKGLSAAHPVEALQHLNNWRKHRKKEKEGLTRNEDHAHRETHHKTFNEAFKKCLKNASTDNQFIKKATKSAKNKGFYFMLETLNHPKIKDHPEAQALKKSITSFIEIACAGITGLDPHIYTQQELKQDGVDQYRKACESIITIPTQ